MSELASFETETLQNIDAANSEEALETLRVIVLGKKGSLSEKMKTLGKMTPEEARRHGPRR